MSKRICSGRMARKKTLSPPLCLIFLLVSVSGQSSPFDDLSSEEIQRVVSIIRESGQFGSTVHFPIIRMQEPLKADWLAGQANNHRMAYAAVFEFATNILTEVKVDLRSNKIVSLLPHEDGIAPPAIGQEYAEVGPIIRNYGPWRDAIIRRGLSFDQVDVGAWLVGTSLDSETGPGKRIMRGVTHYKHPDSRFSHYAVVEGLIVNVNLVTGTVVSFWDDEMVNVTSGIEELPDFTSKPPLTPMTIEQPEGSSIIVNGQEISWYKWNLRWSIDPIYGLQLYHVTYNGDCAQRSVLYKMSLAEMFVPYGASGRGHRWRHAFDVGEYGIGRCATPLVIGVDVPENSILFPCVMARDTGEEPVVVQGCMAAFERDIGVIYKHSDDARRGRELVMTMMATVGNYDYIFDHIFHMDGTIEVKSRLTGIVLIKGIQMETNENEQCLTDCVNLLSDYITGPPHQHFFSYRIDMDVDGVDNYVTEVNVTPDPVEPDPLPWDHGMFSPKKTLLRTETHRDHDFQQHRSWHVINGHSRNEWGSPRGYAIKGGDGPSFTYLNDGHPVFAHAQWITHPFWATVYKDEEQAPGSKFPRTGRPYEGLPSFVSEEESLEDKDAVIWYTFGVTHSTRPEEWPIMNVHKVSGFSLQPFNFMSQNSEMALKDKCA